MHAPRMRDKTLDSSELCLFVFVSLPVILPVLRHILMSTFCDTRPKLEHSTGRGYHILKLFSLLVVKFEVRLPKFVARMTVLQREDSLQWKDSAEVAFRKKCLASTNDYTNLNLFVFSAAARWAARGCG